MSDKIDRRKFTAHDLEATIQTAGKQEIKSAPSEIMKLQKKLLAAVSNKINARRLFKLMIKYAEKMQPVCKKNPICVICKRQIHSFLYHNQVNPK